MSGSRRTENDGCVGASMAKIAVGFSWLLVYTGAVFSYLYVFYEFIAGRISQMILWPLGLNLIANLYYPVVKRYHRRWLEAVVILVVVVTTVISVLATIGRYPLVAFWQGLYLLWVLMVVSLKSNVWR
ncbi:MAG: hypothetical protein BWY68_00644 [bacterium ADurb.Bin400]|nr:MAG: hypothetical protein BWY68_00644 [bacterium ADurb.Bin400]